MKRYSMICSTAVITLGFLTACGQQEASYKPAPVRPVKVFTVAGGASSALRNFPGVVDASQRAELAFRVPGQLQEILVREGERVEQNQVLARLDPTEYEIALEDRQATFDNAESNFVRAEDLVQDGNISKLDFDQMEANFRTSRAALTQAKQDMEYTELRAPFAGRVARRLVQNFEDIIAKQEIFRLQNIDQLEIKIDMPENLIQQLRPAEPSSMAYESEELATDLVSAWASFDGRPDLSFPLSIKEVATKADKATQTFQVTLIMPAPREFSILPGMTAAVMVDFSGIQDDNELKWVPVDAVQADARLDALVWILDGNSMTVSARPIEVGRMADGQIEVKRGLVGGEEIVAVGAAYLAEGMEVSRMIQGEQAIPRADDPR